MSARAGQSDRGKTFGINPAVGVCAADGMRP